MTTALLHKRIKFAKNYVYRNSGLKIPDGYGDLQAFGTNSSKWHSFLCPHF